MLTDVLSRSAADHAVSGCAGCGVRHLHHGLHALLPGGQRGRPGVLHQGLVSGRESGQLARTRSGDTWRTGVCNCMENAEQHQRFNADFSMTPFGLVPRNYVPIPHENTE